MKKGEVREEQGGLRKEGNRNMNGEEKRQEEEIRGAEEENEKKKGERR
jgi:hypothetical protein